MTEPIQQKGKQHREVDAKIGNLLIEVKFGVDSVRAIRASLMQVAYLLSEEPISKGYLVLVESPITVERLREEWARAVSVLRDDVLHRLTVCLFLEDHFLGIPHDVDTKTQQILNEVIKEQRLKQTPTRTDYSFVVIKLLIHQWLNSREPVTSEWLARTAGCSYPSVARALSSLGTLVHRCPDRRVILRWFPKQVFAALIALADRARSTVRFVDRSGQARSAESHLRRLEKMNPPGVAVGGVLGAKYSFPELDLVGLPRLDLSVHSPAKRMNLDFIEQLDPALKKVDDPLAPANVVVHAVRHADPLFTPREAGLAWADPVECLFDLHEARLELQAAQFLNFLQTRAQAGQVVSKLLDEQ